MKRRMRWMLPVLVCIGWATTRAQDVPFNGQIIDPAGKGVKARIAVQGTQSYTNSDRRGAFGLTNLTDGDTLLIRRSGREVAVPVAGLRAIRIVWLEEGYESHEAPELADYGFGYVKRREMTQSSSGLSGEEIRRRGFTDLQTAIVSLIPGVQPVSGGLRLRGPGSINSSSEALIICDGIAINSLSSVSIYDVESIEVEKGSNMYGLRGANGVIIIRTRKK